jgi:YceI-like domain
MFKSFGVVALALLLVACGVPRPRPAQPQNPAAPAVTPNAPPSERSYLIDADRSELRILVYRAGPLARFGHNHVLVNRAIHGTVKAGAAVSAVFSLQVPVAAFVVDESQARREQGADFEGDIPDDAKAGTLHNMLSAALLDADKNPVISISGVIAAGAAPDASVTVSAAISVAGHESKIAVPVTLQRDSGGVTASGVLELRQTALGLTPYSLMLGALQVQDAMTLKFHIVATPATAG